MKANPWFRFYTEAIDDEKLGLLAFEDRWHFVALLCLKGKGVLDGEPDLSLLARKVALKLGLTVAELENVVTRLSSMGLINAQTFQPKAWDERQMQSDSSSERVAKYRAKKAEKPCNTDETLPSRPSNVIDTEEETEEETEIEKVPTVLVERPASDAYTVPDCPYLEIVKAYAEELPSLPQVEILSEPRKAHMRSRWRDVCGGEKYTKAEGLDWFRWYFAHCRESDFLMGKTGGKNGRVWRADFEWLLLPSNFAKAVEGRYHHREVA